MTNGLFDDLGPWDGPFPKLKGSLDVTFILPVPLGPQHIMVLPRALQYLGLIRRFLQTDHPGRHEILLAPYGVHRRFQVSQSSRQRWMSYSLFSKKWVVADGVGEAVRRAVFLSRGRQILVGNFEYSYPPVFYQGAMRALAGGAQAVRANRRLPDSRFTVPVDVLPLVYQRHLWGTLFNRVLRWFIPLKTSDGLSGAYALPRHLALKVFNQISCPGFLYEIELELLAQANRWSWTDLPTHLHYEKEKSITRILRELLEIAVWFRKFLRNVRQQKYEFLKRMDNHLIADDWGMSPGVNTGILRLARLGHFKHVSIMAGASHATYQLKQLRRVPGMKLGLHFNLTTPPHSPWKVLWSWFLWRTTGSSGFIRFCRRELIRQIHWLKQHKIRPIHLDGHHHVHALPGLLNAVADILKKEGIRYIRVPCDRSFGVGVKVEIIYLMGKSLSSAMREHGFQYMPFCYLLPPNFTTSSDLVYKLNHTVGSEVLAHPAAYDDIAKAAPYDTYRKERVMEYHALRLLALAIKLP